LRDRSCPIIAAAADLVFRFFSDSSGTFPSHQGSHAAVFMDKQPPAYIFSYALPAAV
jgi:hypothetical protein